MRARKGLRNEAGCRTSEARLARSACAEATKRAGTTCAEMTALTARGL